MSELIDLAIILLVALVQASLQLGVSCLLLLYHASLGQHIKKQTRHLTTNFILGLGLFVTLALTAASFLILIIFGGPLSRFALAVTIGILLGLAIAIWCFYYRHASSGTELWIPRRAAKYINARAKKTESGAEAFALGMMMGCAEIPFALILTITAANLLLGLPQVLQILAIILYAFIILLPLCITKWTIRSGRTVVDVQKFRVRNKQFIKVMSGVGYFTLALVLIAFKLMGV